MKPPMRPQSGKIGGTNANNHRNFAANSRTKNQQQQQSINSRGGHNSRSLLSKQSSKASLKSTVSKDQINPVLLSSLDSLK